MGRAPEIRTSRLLLRRWRPEDLAAFAAMNADPRVMEHFPALLSREESAQLVARCEREFDERGFGLWAVEAPGVAGFIGFTGLHAVPFEAHFTPAVEVGWRMAAAYWGRGYATEAAAASVDFGFTTIGLTEIVSFTSPTNVRSQKVMHRLGMTRDEADDFDHPTLPSGHPLGRQVLYRLQSGPGPAPDSRRGRRRLSLATAPPPPPR